MQINGNRDLLTEETGKKIHIVYHRADLDGKCSGAVCRYYVEKTSGSPVNMIPMDYGDSLDWIEGLNLGDTVYMVDFSLPLAEMTVINTNCNLIWYDHHKSAVEAVGEYGNQIRGIRHYEESACKIAFDALLAPTVKNEDILKAISLLSDADNWNDQNYDDFDDYEQTAIAFNRYLTIKNTAPNKDDGYQFWKDLFETARVDRTEIYICINIGRIILQARDKENKGKMAGNAFVATIQEKDSAGQGALRALCCNGVSSSMAFKSVYDPGIHDVMLSFTFNKNHEYSISFYSEQDGVDVSLIAVGLKGGGHHSASGCNLRDISFDDNIINFVVAE